MAYAGDEQTESRTRNWFARNPKIEIACWAATWIAYLALLSNAPHANPHEAGSCGYFMMPGWVEPLSYATAGWFAAMAIFSVLARKHVAPKFLTVLGGGVLVLIVFCSFRLAAYGGCGDS